MAKHTTRRAKQRWLASLKITRKGVEKATYNNYKTREKLYYSAAPEHDVWTIQHVIIIVIIIIIIIVLTVIIIIMYICHALINALSARMIHINLNAIFYTHVEDSPT